MRLFSDLALAIAPSVSGSVHDATPAQIDHRAGHRARQIGDQERRGVRELRERSQPFEVRHALEESTWIEPAPDTLLDSEDGASQRPDEQIALRESIGLAFIAALQALSPKQRAALLLVDVLGWNAQETATVLETSVVSVKPSNRCPPSHGNRLRSVSISQGSFTLGGSL